MLTYVAFGVDAVKAGTAVSAGRELVAFPGNESVAGAGDDGEQEASGHARDGTVVDVVSA